ncbi:MAG: TlpA family protein disulfide reductase [Candidatus Kariarchaeaceae archaeon]|jgi:thiol-disulfide isomerase/thioredoxin
MKKNVSLPILLILILLQTQSIGAYSLAGTYQNLNGAYVPYNTFDGSILLIEAFSTTCGACINQHPIMESLYQSHGSEATIISISINEGDTLETLSNFVNDHPTQWPIGLDPDQSLANREGVTHTPTFILYDKEGARQYFYKGGLSLLDLQNLLDAYIEEDQQKISDVTKSIEKEPQKSFIGDIFSSPAFQLILGLFIVLVVYFQLTKKPPVTKENT